MTNKKEYQRKWERENKEKIHEYWHRWYYERGGKEKCREKMKRYNQTHKEEKRKYYKEHKDEIYKMQTKYRLKNKEKWNKIQNDRRKKKAIELKEKGQMFVYLTKTKREERMIKHLSRKLNITLEESKKKLESYDWNIKGILKGDN